MKETDFAPCLAEWYAANARPLPWRLTRDPYRVWLSEVILQQTRIAQGIGYYRRFVERFPTVQALAAATLDEVLTCWQGLGYYSRARNLHRAAQSVVQMGGFPTDYAGVRALAGVGDYTAAAICSIAYGLPCPVVDGNVHRVLSRWQGEPYRMEGAADRRRIAQAAARLMGDSDAALFNQGVMELGELVCLPGRPRCHECPLAPGCRALQQGRIGELPLRRQPPVRKQRCFAYLWVTSGDHCFIAQRGDGDIWKNLYELPLVESDAPLSPDALAAHPLLAGWMAPGEPLPPLRLVAGGVRHLLTHRLIVADFYHLALPPHSHSFAAFRRVPVAQLCDFPFPRLLERFISQLLDV